MAQSSVQNMKAWYQGVEQGKCNAVEAEVKDFSKKGIVRDTKQMT